MRTVHFIPDGQTQPLCGAEETDQHGTRKPDEVTCEHCLALMEGGGIADDILEQPEDPTEPEAVE